MIPFASFYTLQIQISGEEIMNMISLDDRFIEWDIDNSEYFYLPKISNQIRELKKCLE